MTHLFWVGFCAGFGVGFAMYALMKFIFNTIAEQEEIRKQAEQEQKETEELSKKVDVMIIVGGKNSSNTKELEVISTKNCEKVYLIQDYNDLKKRKINRNCKIGIMAGASTPDIVVEEIIDYLKGEGYKIVKLSELVYEENYHIDNNGLQKLN